MMNTDRIFVDEPTLRRNVLNYLRSANGANILETFDASFLVCLFVAIVGIIVGLCMLPTIFFTIAGLKTLWHVITLKPFEDMRRRISDHPEELFPLIAHGVIIGPDQKHALVLGTFRPYREYSADWLARKAALFGAVYTERGEGALPQYDELRKLLRDDSYTPHRRRRVPEPYAQGGDLMLFDVVINVKESRLTPIGTLHAFVADYGPAEGKGQDGEIYTIPWYAVGDAVQVNE